MINEFTKGLRILLLILSGLSLVALVYLAFTYDKWQVYLTAFGALVALILLLLSKRYIWLTVLALPLLFVSIFVLQEGIRFHIDLLGKRSAFEQIKYAVNFEEDYPAAIDKAKKENKPIFLDFYTDWCSPCLGFSKRVLTDSLVGQEMNRSFINLLVNAEKGEGIDLAERYNVGVYPTLLIVDSSGRLLKNVVDKSGAVPSKQKMIELAKKYQLGPEITKEAVSTSQ